MKTYLITPLGYRGLNPKDRKRICNGCGPGKVGSWFIPNTLWGLNVREACDIHDYMYHVGKTEFDKKYADLVFYENMKKIVYRESRWVWLQRLRLRRAWKYYVAVSVFGSSSFNKSR